MTAAARLFCFGGAASAARLGGLPSPLGDGALCSLLGAEKQQASANASNAELLAELRLGFSEVRLGFSKFEGQLKSLEETVTGVKGQLNTLEERVTGLRKDFNGWVGSVGDEMNIMSRSIRSLEGSRRGVAWGTEQASVQAAAEMLAAREEQRLGGGLGQDGVVVRGVVVGGQVFFCEVKGGGEKRREVDGAGVLVVFEGEGGKCKVQLKPFVVECKTGSVSWPVAGKFVNLVSGQAVSKSKKGSARAQLFSSRGGWGALLQEGRTGRGGPVFAFLLDCVMAEVAALAAQWDATPPTKGEVEAALAAGARAGVTAVLAAPNMDDAVRSAVHAEGVVTLCWAAPWDLQPA